MGVLAAVTVDDYPSPTQPRGLHVGERTSEGAPDKTKQPPESNGGPDSSPEAEAEYKTTHALRSAKASGT